MFARLEFGDNAVNRYIAPSYNVVSYGSKINRTHDCCLPHANPVCRSFEIVVNSPDKSDLNIVEWYIDGSQKSGRIVFFLDGKGDNSAEYESIVYFEDAYCSAISEHYDIMENAVRRLKLTIVPMSMKVCDIEFVRPE